MEPTFRQSMIWLHSWTGVVLGGLLFAIFWMGTLSVFDDEIDRWMAPTTRLAAPAELPIDRLQPSLRAASTAHSPYWNATLPNERQPFIRVHYQAAGERRTHTLDPATGAELPDPGTWAGTGFLYPFHYMLHIRVAGVGTWLVGVAAMAMLALCVSGVVIHRKIFADFFTFRPRKKLGRAVLDLHNIAGVTGLPFHYAIALSGLVIFATTYFPSGWQAAYGDLGAYNAEAFGDYGREPSGIPGKPIVALDSTVAEARRLWGGDEPTSLSVSHPGDAASYLRVHRSYQSRLARAADNIYFDAATGRVLRREREAGPTKPMATLRAYVGGLHVVQFRHWTLRWLYFAMGLAGCVLIATGYIFWLDSRGRKHAQRGLAGVRVVEGLTVGSVTGIIGATLAFFAINRLLPLGITFAGIERAALEVWTFYLAWLAAFAHAWTRPERAWAEQCQAIALLAVAAVLLNWITTGDHLIRSLTHCHLWPIAGMDLLLLVGGGIAALAAHRINRGSAKPPARRVRGRDPIPHAAE